MQVAGTGCGMAPDWIRAGIVLQSAPAAACAPAASCATERSHHDRAAPCRASAGSVRTPRPRPRLAVTMPTRTAGAAAPTQAPDDMPPRTARRQRCDCRRDRCDDCGPHGAARRFPAWRGTAARSAHTPVATLCAVLRACGRDCPKPSGSCPGWPERRPSSGVTAAVVYATDVDNRNAIDHAMARPAGQRVFSTSCHNATVAVVDSKRDRHHGRPEPYGKEQTEVDGSPRQPQSSRRGHRQARDSSRVHRAPSQQRRWW